MYNKVCPYCRTTSYCASDQKPWICPKCQEDISEKVGNTNVKNKNLKERLNKEKYEESTAMASF